MLSEQDSQFTKLTGAKQTMSSWAEIIETFDALPEVYKDSFRKIIPESFNFPYVVRTPSISGLLGKRSTEKLLISNDEILYILKRDEHRIRSLGFPIKNVAYLEYGNILIYSWITIHGITLEGLPLAYTIEFNTSTARYILPFIADIRQKTAVTQSSTEQAKLDALPAEAYKFRNFAYESLNHGEMVNNCIWQPKITLPTARIFHFPIKRLILLDQLLILSNKELILIRDDPRSKVNRGARYGGVWEYMPLKKITSVALKENKQGLWKLTVELAPHKPVDINFDSTQKQALNSLLEKLEQIRSAAHSI